MTDPAPWVDDPSAQLLCRGKSLKTLTKELRRGFGCNGLRFVGGFSKSLTTCETHSSDGAALGGIASMYVAPYDEVAQNYADSIEPVQYTPTYFKDNQDVLEMVVGDSQSSEDDEGLAMEKDLQAACNFDMEEEVLFRVCPLRPFKDAKNRPLGTLYIMVDTNDVVEATVPTHDFEYYERRRDLMCNMTPGIVEEYYAKHIEPLLTEDVMRNVKQVKIRYKHTDYPFCEDSSTSIPFDFATIEGTK